MSDYANALRVAGAEVHAMHFDGDWQGQWLARVTLPDGRTGWILDYFGSCSGCDAFEAEFGWDYHVHESHDGDGRVLLASGDAEACEKCRELQERLRKFGARYFPYLCTTRDLLEDKEWLPAKFLEILQEERLKEAEGNDR